MNHSDSTTLFAGEPVLIGMVHLPPLPGSPKYGGSLDDVITAALADAEVLNQAGFSAIMIENLGDCPYYPDRVPSETVAAMTVVADRIRQASKIPVGVNVLRNDGRSALSIAVAARLQFIRVNVLTSAMITDQGVIQGKAHLLQRAKSALHANAIKVLADFRVKHAASFVERDLEQEVEELFERALCDAIIVSGSGSGKPVDRVLLQQVRRAAPEGKILVGSGLDFDNAHALLEIANGAIVGTSIKVDGLIHNRIDRTKAREMVKLCRR